MEIYLKRWFWTLPLFMIVVCAILAALGVNHVVEAKFLLGGDSTTRPAHHTVKPVKRDSQKPAPSKDAQDVIARNIFCSTCDPPKPPDPSNTPTQPVDENHPPNTTLPLALLATIVAKDAKASAATVLNTASFKSGSYGVGDWIPDAGQVRRIHPKAVDFWNKNVNRLERVEFLGQPGAPVAQNTPAPPPPPPTNEPPNPDADLLASVDKGVKRIDDSHYDIDRGLVDKILTDPTAAARAARIVPSIKDGKPNGFKLYAIRPNSIFGKIGLQNGDTVKTINGNDMSTPDAALALYSKLRNASHLSVQVERRGEAQTMDYTIK